MSLVRFVLAFYLVSVTWSTCVLAYFWTSDEAPRERAALWLNTRHWRLVLAGAVLLDACLRPWLGLAFLREYVRGFLHGYRRRTP